MNVFDLLNYDKIVLWGAGKDFQSKYKKQFFVNACVDNDKDKIGKCINGIPVISVQELKKDFNDKNIFIIISSRKFYKDIIKQIERELNQINVDVIDLDTMLMIYGHHRKAFSLWGLDMFVADIFERSGFSISDTSYIDLGANHPFFGNSTANLYLKGARGILIEPTSDYLEQLKNMRPGDICLNCGIGNKRENVKLYRFSNLYRNTFSVQEKERNISLGYNFIGEELIPVYTLDDIIEKHKVDTSITYLNLMIPRADIEILKQFDYLKYNFPIISFCYSDKDIFDYPICKDYEIFMTMLRRIILVRKDIYHILL